METSLTKRAVLSEEHQTQIHHWQDRASSEPEQAVQGIVARLFLNCQESLQCLIQHLEAELAPANECRALRRCLNSLQLWSDGYGAASGVLDTTLDRSKSLRLTTLSVLSPMCRAISHGLKFHVVPVNSDERIARLCAAAAELHGQTRWLLTDHEEDSSASDTDYSSSSDDDVDNKLQDLVRDIKTFTTCLIDLGTALDCPALEPEHEDRPSLVTLEHRSAYDYHTELIRAKFEHAELCLLQSLGRASWHRYQRMQHERDSNAHLQLLLPSSNKSQAVNSEFQDSGIGTSLPRSVPAYAESVMSFMSSISGGIRPLFPPLSAEAKSGALFECNACGKFIRATNSRDWRKHLYLDLQPYNCLFAGCGFTQEPFATRQLWIEHLELEHGLGPNWDAIECPLCLVTTESGKSAILLHFAEHVEDIALTSLPREVDLDADSESATDSEFNEKALATHAELSTVSDPDPSLAKDVTSTHQGQPMGPAGIYKQGVTMLEGHEGMSTAQTDDASEPLARSSSLKFSERAGSAGEDINTQHQGAEHEGKGNKPDDFHKIDRAEFLSQPESLELLIPSSQASIDIANMGVQRLRAHYQQRQQHLLVTYGQQIPQQHVVQMHQLMQLIRSKEQAQLQHHQQTKRLRDSKRSVDLESLQNTSVQSVHTEADVSSFERICGAIPANSALAASKFTYERRSTCAAGSAVCSITFLERARLTYISFPQGLALVSKLKSHVDVTDTATIVPEDALLDYREHPNPDFPPVSMESVVPGTQAQTTDQDPLATFLAPEDYGDPDLYAEDALHIPPDSPAFEGWQQLTDLQEHKEIGEALRPRTWSWAMAEEQIGADEIEDRSGPTQWLCSACYDGPFAFASVYRCRTCNHRRCGDCETVEE